MTPIKLHNFEIISYLDIDEGASRELLDARNNELVRSQMVNQDIISWDNHNNFIKALHFSNKYYYAVYQNKLLIGALNFDLNIPNKIEWGMYLNPNLIGSGQGVVLEILALDISLLIFNAQEVVGKIKKSNLTTLSMHERFGFQIDNEDDDFHYISLSRTKWKNNREKFLKMFKLNK